jgi:ATP phosphoribosyltransferase
LQVVEADQLNEVDKALQEPTPPSQTTVAVAPAKPVAAVNTVAQENSTWDETSLIGKIFIAFGALLTIASAARMFMA